MATIQLVKDAVYRGRIEAFASRLIGKGYIGGKVKEALEGQGFTGVTVWMDSSDLPGDWPPEALDDVSGSGHTQAWVEGTWSKDAGDYPGSGSQWQVIDYWPTYIPQDETSGCILHGYTCSPDAPEWSTKCCPGSSCVTDDANMYGGGNRCMMKGAEKINEPKSSMWSTIGWLAVGAVALGLGWTYALPAMGIREKRNPGYNPASRKNPTGDWVWISHMGKKWEAFLPDVKITSDDPSYVLHAMHGYSNSLAVEDIDGKIIGWIPIGALGYPEVKTWMKATNYIV